MSWEILDRHRPEGTPLVSRRALAAAGLALVIAAANLSYILYVSPVWFPPPTTSRPLVERLVDAKKVRADLVKEGNDETGLWSIEEVIKQIEEDIARANHRDR